MTARIHGGRFPIQIWRRIDEDHFVRVYAGEGPAWSAAVEGWLFAPQGERPFGIASDEAGTAWWLTPEETAQRQAEAERAAKEAALRRVAELEALLGRRSSRAGR